MDIISIDSSDKNAVKLVVALRTARSVVGWSQDELAKLSGIPKITIARFETLDGSLRAEQLLKLLNLYASKGVNLTISEGEGFSLNAEGTAIQFAAERLADSTKRRSDRRKGRAPLRRPASEKVG